MHRHDHHVLDLRRGDRGAGNIGYGVSVSGSANVSIMGSTFSHNTADGIDFNSSPNAILSGDTVQSNGVMESC